MRAVADLLLPPACPVCGESGNGLCPLCDANLQRRLEPGCPRCGELVIAAGEACGSDHGELRHLLHLVAPLRFAGTGGALVRRFKLDADPAAGQWLARAMAGAWAPFHRGAWRHAVLVPVPLHRTRAAERGFDQAEWLARAVASRLGLDVAPNVLARRRATLPQGDPRVLSRSANIEGAFAVVRASRIAGRRVVLVDDVFTSGATMRSCAAVLRAAGALETVALTACRS